MTRAVWRDACHTRPIKALSPLFSETQRALSLDSTLSLQNRRTNYEQTTCSMHSAHSLHTRDMRNATRYVLYHCSLT